MAAAYDSDDTCPGCTHPLGEHDADNGGCLNGWEWDTEGVATTDGCYCNLTLAP